MKGVVSIWSSNLRIFLSTNPALGKLVARQQKVAAAARIGERRAHGGVALRANGSAIR
jgi:hypothetical protein